MEVCSLLPILKTVGGSSFMLWLRGFNRGLCAFWEPLRCSLCGCILLGLKAKLGRHAEVFEISSRGFGKNMQEERMRLFVGVLSGKRCLPGGGGVVAGNGLPGSGRSGHFGCVGRGRCVERMFCFFAFLLLSRALLTAVFSRIICFALFLNSLPRAEANDSVCNRFETFYYLCFSDLSLCNGLFLLFYGEKRSPEV